MYITARERLILKRLLSTRVDNLTTKQLAEELDVSVRTIHRDLKGIEQLLQKYDLELVKKPGVGIQLSGAAGQMEALKQDLFRQSRREYTPEERRILILCTLLEAKEPVKLISLASELDVTMATVSHDLTKLESGLEKFDLSLIRKRGYGVEIVGSESAKRRAMSNLIAENIDEVQFLSLIRENIQNKTKKRLNPFPEDCWGWLKSESSSWWKKWLKKSANNCLILLRTVPTSVWLSTWRWRSNALCRGKTLKWIPFI